MSVRQEKLTVGPGIPLWRLLPDGNGGRLVILLHGATQSKDDQMGFGTLLAERGFQVVIPDARRHGERVPSDAGSRLAEDFVRAGAEIVEETARDVSLLIDAFAASTAGLAGYSMGSDITYLALTLDRRVEAAVSICGPGDFEWVARGHRLEPDFARHVAEVNPARHPERFAPCALLIQHGLHDEVVPPDLGQSLYDKLRPYYPSDRLRLVMHPCGHEVTPEMQAATAAWFDRFLK